MDEEMEKIFSELNEENKNILLLVANGIKLGQENRTTMDINTN